MFKNIGGKIKTLAEILAMLGMIGSIILGIIELMAGENVLIGFLIFIIGSIASWLSSCFIYGFGQLIENTDFLVKRFDYNNSKYIDNDQDYKYDK